MNENVEAHLLAGIGLARGIGEEACHAVTLERVEKAGLACAVVAVGLAGYAIAETLRETAEELQAS